MDSSFDLDESLFKAVNNRVDEWYSGIEEPNEMTTVFKQCASLGALIAIETIQKHLSGSLSSVDSLQCQSHQELASTETDTEPSKAL